MTDANDTVRRLKTKTIYEPMPAPVPVIEDSFVVLRRSNGHYEPLGQVIQSFPTPQEAEDEARKLSSQHHGTKFTVFHAVYEAVTSPELREYRA